MGEGERESELRTGHVTESCALLSYIFVFMALGKGNNFPPLGNHINNLDCTVEAQGMVPVPLICSVHQLYEQSYYIEFVPKNPLGLKHAPAAVTLQHGRSYNVTTCLVGASFHAPTVPLSLPTHGCSTHVRDHLPYHDWTLL